LASVLRLRARLILEEALETIDALGYRVRDPELLVRERPGVLDLVEIVDGCCDIMVVTTGTLSACGVSDLPVQLAVDINNLAKFGGDGRLDEYGKWVKPSDHQPPNLKEVLRALSAAG
jgi:predicted HAD superfamily Cof-like phosphohydrolase